MSFLWIFRRKIHIIIRWTDFWENKRIENYNRFYNLLFIIFFHVYRSEERQYCWNCNSRLSPRCGRKLSRHLARSVSVPPTRNVYQSVPYIRSKSMPYREKDTNKMPTSMYKTCIIKINLIMDYILLIFNIWHYNIDFENSSIKTCFSLSALHPSTVNVEDGQQAPQRPYNSLTKKIK